MTAASIDERLAAAGLPPLPRRLWAEIDEAALVHNVGVVRGLAGPAVALNAVVKADAYGHGLVAAAHAFAAAGVDRLCVAGLDEAQVLRAAAVTIPILVLFAVPPELVMRAARADIEIVAADETLLAQTLTEWRARAAPGDTLAVHLEVETGLARAGLRPDAVGRAARQIADAPGAILRGLWSHLARSDDGPATAVQVDAFERATEAVRAAGVPIPPRHIDATGGLFTGHAPAYEGVRVGLALYGILPEGLSLAPDAAAPGRMLEPAMSLRCLPLRIERVARGTPVSYGALWHAPRASLIATLPFGYGDGLPRHAAEHAQALVRGRRVPLVGSVAMDAVMADVTDVPGVTLDDEFVLLGRQGDEQISALELARLRTTIPYEVVTSVAYRVPRVYHAGSVLKGLRTLETETRSDSDPAADLREPNKRDHQRAV